MLGLVKRTCRDFDDRKTLRTLYSALAIQFRIILSYTIPLHQNGHWKVWEVQKRATKFICKTEECYAGHKESKFVIIGKGAIVSRFHFFRLSSSRNNWHWHIEHYVDFYKETDHFSFRHNDKLTLKMRYARTNVLKYTYFHRVVGAWTPFPLHSWGSKCQFF